MEMAATAFSSIVGQASRLSLSFTPLCHSRALPFVIPAPTSVIPAKAGIHPFSVIEEEELSLTF